MASIGCLVLKKTEALQLNSDINIGGDLEDLLFLQITEEPEAAGEPTAKEKHEAEQPPMELKVPDVEVETVDDQVNK